jgi:hypothetical protein
MSIDVTFRFRNKKEKDRFLLGLADGFGEEYCTLRWGVENGVALVDAVVVDVNPYGDTVFDEDDDDFDDYGMQKMDGDRSD